MQLLNPNTLIITALAAASLAAAAPIDVPGPGPIVGHSHGNTANASSNALATPTTVPHGAGPGCGAHPPAKSMLAKRDNDEEEKGGKPVTYGVPNGEPEVTFVNGVPHIKLFLGGRQQLQRRGSSSSSDDDMSLTLSAEEYAKLLGQYKRLQQGKPDNGKYEFAVKISPDTFAQLTGTDDEMEESERDRRLRQHHKRDGELQRRENIFKEAWLGLTQEHFHEPLIPGSTNRHDAIPPPFYLDKPGWDMPAREAAEIKEELKKARGGG
ncbi:hypothetical protein NpPPO83_00006117 [Neofusicoccum parvum]|uniref:Uncharacterized protein n=1 Tax=Neofusicoccum parvum TaxID=310453 RepID=A0ACB5RU25_9PEZI|nr:hypothetical protein NpPPO83_00006117 [Neofusicoccum parvum]